MRGPDHTEGPVEHPLQLVQAEEQHPIADDQHEDAHEGHQTTLGLVPVQDGVHVGIAESAGNYATDQYGINFNAGSVLTHLFLRRSNR